MNIFAVTQKGINKLENEDRVVVGKSIISEGTFHTPLTVGVIAVADGVGGNNAGAVASHFVASKISSMDDISPANLSAVNDELLRLSSERTEYTKMATTLSGLFIGQRDIHLFSIGNTRIYLLQGRKYLKQLTTDDTTLNHLLASGQLSKEDAENFKRKNEITACFGGGASHLFKIKCSTIEPLASPFMMTSDGVHDYVSIDQMEDIIAEHGISVAACDSLISAARAGGSHDDISVILGEI